MYADPPYALDDRLLNRWRGHRARGAVALQFLLRPVADVVPVAPLLVGRVRRVHAGAAAGAVDKPTKQSIEFDAMGVARCPRILFEALLGHVEGRLVDDGFVLSGKDLIAHLHLPGVENVAEQFVDVAPA